MEFGFYLYPFSAALSLVLLLSAWRALLRVWRRPKRLESELRRQGVRGNCYRVWYGDMKDQVKAITEAWSKPMELNHRITERVTPFVHSTVQKYGKTSLIWQGTTPRVLICDPAVIKEALSDRSGCIQKVPVTPQTRSILTGVATLEGEAWATRRKLINHAFYLEKLRAMLPAFLNSCDNLVGRWVKLLAGDDARRELDIWPELQSLTKDAISRTAFGSSYEEGRMIFELQREQVELVLEDVRRPSIPGFRHLPTAKNKRKRYLDKEINKLLLHIIEKKERAMKRGESCRDDLLGLLLQRKGNADDGIADEDTVDKELHKITTQDIIDECKLFYFAGQETTSAWLTWTIILLAQHQDWQQRAREEVVQLCGRQVPPDYEILGNLKIVTMVLNEVFRLYPPVTSLFRYTPTGVKLGGITYPAGVEFLLHTMMVHHDPTYWGDDAEQFNPQRFSPGVLKPASKDTAAFFPFGAGPRICLGQNFAMLEAKIALVRLLQHFRFELSPSYTHAPITVITLQPQFGAQVFVQRI